MLLYKEAVAHAAGFERIGRIFISTNNISKIQIKTAWHSITCLTVKKSASGPALIVGSRSLIRLLSEAWESTFAEAVIAYAMHEFGGECTLAQNGLSSQMRSLFNYDCCNSVW